MKKTIALLALLAAFPALSTDMYLAAIPILVDLWQQPLATVNLTLVFFFVTYCAFLLLYGPLSDRYGRKPPLLVGLILYIGASLLCAGAQSVEQMIVARIIQGAGAASASSIAFAICKDLFENRLRQRIFLQLGVIIAASPMVAPLIGGFVIESLSWRWVFVFQTLLAVVAAAGVLFLEESLQERSRERVSKMFQGYTRLAGNHRYFLLVITLSCIGVPFFAFIAISSDIIIGTLGFSERQYGYFYGANASAFLFAPLVFSRAVRRFHLRNLLPISFLGVLLSSLPMITALIPQPYRLALPMWLVTFFFGFGRPPGNNLILEQVEQDVGSASSLMVFVFFMTGALSMWFISLGWKDPVLVLGLLGIASATFTLTAWLALNRMLGLKMP